MVELKRDAVEHFLQEAFGPEARLLGMGDIGAPDQQGVKQFGFGKPVLISYEVGGDPQHAVLSTMRGDKYGHQFYWDRAAVLMFQHETSGRLPKHAKPMALGYVNADDRLVHVRDVREFFLLVEKVPGMEYFKDLVRIQKKGARPADTDQVRAFAHWLSEVHAVKNDDPHLYYRRIRNLIGADECIMGLIDEAYPRDDPEYPQARFIALEQQLVAWRWKLEAYAHRLAAVHGDFHPWNVLILESGDFRVLDRSRGEWGEPAGDLAAMAVNYLLFGVLESCAAAPGKPPRLDGAFLELFKALFQEYLDLTKDAELLDVIAPFFVFRCLVVASPEWYPDHPPQVRQALFTFMERVLEEPRFDYTRVNGYLREQG